MGNSAGNDATYQLCKVSRIPVYIFVHIETCSFREVPCALLIFFSSVLSLRLSIMMTTPSPKRGPESPNVKPEWESAFLFIPVGSSAECLACPTSFSTVRKYHLERHYKARHERDHGLTVGSEREDLIRRLKAQRSPDINVSFRYCSISRKNIYLC